MGKLYHVRGLAPVNEGQLGIGENRDTLYSLGVFDLTEPVTITKPETNGRYQSMLVQNEDQYLKLSTTKPGKYTITREQAGTRYIGVNFRTFVDPNDPADVKEVKAIQDADRRGTGVGRLVRTPRLGTGSHTGGIDGAFRVLYYTMDDWSNAFGDVGEVDPVKFYVASASGWTGVPEPHEALILQGAPPQNDGTTPHTLTVRDVPVDGFWSVTVYDRDLGPQQERLRRLHRQQRHREAERRRQRHDPLRRRSGRAQLHLHARGLALSGPALRDA